jgi:O-antigen ligase
MGGRNFLVGKNRGYTFCVLLAAQFPPMIKPASSPRFSLLEKIVLTHVGVLLISSTWAFGGNIGWARLALSAWGSLSLPIAIAAFFQRLPDGGGNEARRKAWWLIAPALYAALIVASAFNPSFRSISWEGSVLLVHKGPVHPHWPSTVNPVGSLASLWFAAGAYLSAYNVALVLRSRTGLRFVFTLVAVNTLALSVFGTIQSLLSAGYFFGATISPNTRFFATFIYNNHWGAFMILALSVVLGLLFYHVRRFQGRDLWHSPFSVALIGVLLIAATAPISASRAATAMTAVLLTVACIHALGQITVVRRRARRPVWPPVLLLLILIIGTTGAVGWLGLRSISERVADTRAALNQNENLLAGRVELYRDSWELVARKPVFGWGLDSYGTAFQLIRPRPLQANRQYERSYDTAHNDWLQSLAETGFMGTALLVLAAVLPLSSLRHRGKGHPLIVYPLLGLGLVLAYAFIEFPFSSGAFVILFWTCLFSLIRYARLQPDHASTQDATTP